MQVLCCQAATVSAKRKLLQCSHGVFAWGRILQWLSDLVVWGENLLNIPFVRLVSYVASPLIALVSFGFNVKDRFDLKRLQARLTKRAMRLGQARTEAAAERRNAAQKQAEAETALNQARQKGAEVARLRNELEGITKGSGQLWKLRPPKPFSEYQSWMRVPNSAPIVTFGNLKGGVGKTTLAGNFAAYVSETLKKPVLVIDLDYQGSLSNMLMLAAEKEVERSEVDALLAPDADLAAFTAARKHLEPKLQRAWLVPASFSLAERENQLLLQWMLDENGSIDVR